MTKQLILCAALAMPLAGVSVLTGCDREIASESKVETKSDGTRVTEEKTVSETADGGIKTEETKSVDKPDKPDTVKKEESTVKTEDGTVKKEEKTTVDR